MIIKFILIVLGILLGLVLLAILLVLLCPVRYRVLAGMEGRGLQFVKGEAKVSWLFHAISVKVRYEEGKLTKTIRIFGIPLETILGVFRKKKKEPAGKSDFKSSDVKQQEYKTAESAQERHLPTEKSEMPKPAEIKEKEKSILSAFKRFFMKIFSFPGRLRKKLKKVTLTIRNIYGKIDWWKQFLTHPKTKSAISFVWKDAKKLIHHVLPVKAEGNLTFGCEDPSITGAALAFLGMTIPFHKNVIKVTPLFDGENYLEGNLRLKGRIYGIVLAKAAIEIYFNKNVKYVINRWKHHKED
jgi:hypothetical protein